MTERGVDDLDVRLEWPGDAGDGPGRDDGATNPEPAPAPAPAGDEHRIVLRADARKLTELGAELSALRAEVEALRAEVAALRADATQG